MTLIEILISVAILAMISTMMWSGFAQTARNKRSIDGELDYYHGVHQAMERIARELRMAYVSAHLNPSLALRKHITAFIGTDRLRGDRIDFTAFSHRRLYRDAHESDQEEISYFLADDPDDSEARVLARRSQTVIDDDPQKGGSVFTLLHGVEDFQLEYLDPQNNVWRREWDSTQSAQQPNRLPSQVKVTLKVRHPFRDTERTFATRVSIPLTMALNHARYSR